MTQVNVRPLAETDVAEAYEWYEQQAAGLGAQFLDEGQTVYNRVEQFPTAFPEVYRDARRALVRRFPYAVFYCVRDDIAHILACTRVRRHPGHGEVACDAAVPRNDDLQQMAGAAVRAAGAALPPRDSYGIRPLLKPGR